jgi:hypothetical protein
MPRYAVSCSTLSSAERSRAFEVLATRFPEIDVVAEHHHATTQMLVCVAPSETHVRRWATAVQLRRPSIRPIEATTDTPRSET